VSQVAAECDMVDARCAMAPPDAFAEDEEGSEEQK
jgi:hypothetical protein